MIGVLAIAGTLAAVYAFYRASSLRMAPAGPQDSGSPPAPGPGPAPDLEGKIEILWRGIGRAEGYFSDDPNVIPRRAHNPCDMANGDIGLGTTGPSKVTIYPTDDDGIDACRRKLRRIVLGQSDRYPVGMTFMQLGRIWVWGTDQLSDAQESTARNWARTVAAAVGATLDTTLADWRNA